MIFRPEYHNDTCVFIDVCVAILTMKVVAIVYLFCSEL